MSVANHYAVLLRSETRPSPEQIRRAFRTFSHLTDADAIRLAANAEGVLMRGLSADEARAFHRALTGEGVDAACVAEANLPVLPKTIALHRIELTDAHLVVFDQIGRPEKISWGQIALLGLGSLTHVGFTQFTTMERKLGFNPITGVWPKTTTGVGHKLEKDSQMLLNIVLGQSLKRFEVNAAGFPFRYVVDRPEFSVIDNIVWLANEMICHSPQALLNRGARDVRDGIRLVRGYATPQIFSDEMVWLLWNQMQRQGSLP